MRVSETPKSALLAAQAKVRALQRVTYTVKRVYDYPAEQYHVERLSRLHQDYVPGENKARLRYRLESDLLLDIYNGTDRFTCNKQSKTLQLSKSVGEEELLSSGGLQHSLYMLRDGLGALGERGSGQVTCRFLPSPDPSVFVIEARLSKCSLEATGRLQPGNFDQHLELTLDRKSLLPRQLVQRFPQNGTITNTYSDYALNPPPLDAPAYLYSSYLTTYALEASKKLKPLAVGSLAPTWALARADGTGMLSLHELRGKHVVLDFFIVYCGPCIESVPKLNRWQQEHPAVAFVSINVGDTRELVRGFVQRNKLQLPTVLGSPKLAEDYGFAAFPRLFLLDPEGRVLDNGSAGSEGIERLLRTL